jgi:hypothetical protein
VDHLHDRNSGQCLTQARVDAGLDLIDELERRGATESLLLDDQLGRRFAGEKEGRNAWRHGSRDIPDAGLGNGAGPARHSRHQADSRRSHSHSERGFFLRSDATDLNPGPYGEHNRVVGGYYVR